MYEQDEYEEEEFETLHVYLYEEEPKYPMSPRTRDSILGAFTIVYILAGMIVLCFIPTQPAYAYQTISVPAHFLPIQTFLIRTPIIPTGSKTIPAEKSHGYLSVYNGSIFAQTLPGGFILTGKDGVEIAIDQAVTIPPGNAPNYGIATVSAHAVLPGGQGNIQTGDISSVYGSDITIKNLTPFTGGADAQTEIVATSDDTHTALTNTRFTLTAQEKKQPGLLAYPCQEKTEQKDLELAVSWACQFVTYTTPPGVQVVSAQIKGTIVLLQVKIVARIYRFAGK